MCLNRLPVGYTAEVIRPIDFIGFKHPLDFPCGAYFDDMRVSCVTGATCTVDVEVPVPVTHGSGGLHDVAAVLLRVLFRYVLVIFHLRLQIWSFFSNYVPSQRNSLGCIIYQTRGKSLWGAHFCCLPLPNHLWGAHARRACQNKKSGTPSSTWSRSNTTSITAFLIFIFILSFLIYIYIRTLSTNFLTFRLVETKTIALARSMLELSSNHDSLTIFLY